MKEFAHSVTMPDGCRLNVREYLPDHGPLTRNLVILHGACEHGGRYQDIAASAASDGWRVIIPDHRGHGLSDGTRVHLRTFDAYLQDNRVLTRHFSLAPARTAVVGHSTGGLIAARLLQQSEPFAQAGCLLSPYLALRISVDRFTLLLGRLLSVVYPKYRFRSRIRSSDLSRDDQYLESRRKDELIVRGVTAGWFFAVQQAQSLALEETDQIRCPVLVLQGDADPVVRPEISRLWCEKVTRQDCEFVMLPGHMHELLQEPDRHQTTRHVLNWLDRQVPASTAPAAPHQQR